MLNSQKLCKDIQSAIEETLPVALEQATKILFPQKSNTGDDIAQQFADTVTEQIAEPLASRIGEAIHAYIKNISIYGTVITVGSMVTQTAVISPATPITGGKVPNTLGIQ